MSMLSCRNSEDSPDAYGYFEAEEIMISSEVPGRLLFFGVDRGMEIDSGYFIAQIDTQALHLSVKGLESQIESIRGKINVLHDQKQLAQIELDGIQKEFSRVSILEAEDAATEQQLDQIDTKLAAGKQRLLSYNSQMELVNREITSYRTQISLMEYQLSQFQVLAPISGRVLQCFVKQGEMVVPNKPLLKMANLEKMDFRAYLSGSQLSACSVGQDVKVLIDGPNGEMIPFPGRISWISNKAEFTPKIIQTREERVNLVYAVIVRVVNDGLLRIGMPGELILN